MTAGKDDSISRLGHDVRQASAHLVKASDDTIDNFLLRLQTLLCANTDAILRVNEKDIAAAKTNGLSSSFLDRLTLTADRIGSMANSVGAILKQPHPCGKILQSWSRPNGLHIQKISVPIGVLGMIYESRPNVTIDAAALAVKSRNGIILRGGSDSAATSGFLYTLVVEALVQSGLPGACVCLVTDQDRSHVGDMLAASGIIDVMIPRGGKSLTSRVMAEAKMPVFAHLDGNCHVYVHEDADLDMALSIVKNAKLRRTGICGAAESLLIDLAFPTEKSFRILTMLLDEGVIVVGDNHAVSFDSRILPASEDDWSSEYLDRKISVKFIEGVQKAVDHINRYGSHHTDAIVTNSDDAADIFSKYVDSAIVIRNASTQFADGGEFGFGAEIGIGTGKLHARGPVGLAQLTTFKYILSGNGQIRPS